MAAPKDRKTAYDIEYARTHVKQIKFNASLQYDADIIAFLETVPNQQRYIKDLIRADMASKGIETKKDD